MNISHGLQVNKDPNLTSGWKTKKDLNIPPRWNDHPNLPLGWKSTLNNYEDEEDIIDKEIEEIKRMKTSKAGKVWEIRKKVIGGKRQPSEATAVINPKTGKLAVTKEEINSASLEYCVETLANNTPEKEHKDNMRQKHKRVQDLLLETDGKFKADFGTFGFIINNFKKSRKRNYAFLTKAGRNFQSVVFKFCQKNDRT